MPLKKEKPPHVQAHLILLVPHKIKRPFTSPPPPHEVFQTFYITKYDMLNLNY